MHQSTSQPPPPIPDAIDSFMNLDTLKECAQLAEQIVLTWMREHSTDPSNTNIKELNTAVQSLYRLTAIRKTLLSNERRLRICSVDDSVWSVFLVTGLEQLFEFTDDVATSLASLQIGSKD